MPKVTFIHVKLHILASTFQAFKKKTLLEISEERLL